MDSKSTSLKRIPIFSSLDEGNLEKLSSIAVEKSYRKGQIIFDQGDPGNSLIILKKGLVKISLVDSNDHEFIIKTLGENDFFGEMSLLDGGQRSATAVTVDETHALLIYREDFIRLVNENPTVALDLLKLLSQRLRTTTDNIANLAFFDAYGKVAKCLLDMEDRIGEKEEDGMVLNLKLSRQELANMAGLTRETFTRILREFQIRGCLDIKGKKLTIRDRNLLEREVDIAVL